MTTIREKTRLDLMGIPEELKWGFLGVLVFMTGVGVESNFLTPYLVNRLGQPEATVSVIITGYSLAVLVASYLAGVLSDLWGPKKVMALGAAIWVVLQFCFLLSVETGNVSLVGATYLVRGFGFPLFTFAFLVWVNMRALPSKQGTAIGWFYVMFTGGLPTLGSLVAIGMIPAFGGGLLGETASLYASIGLVVVGFLMVWFGCNHPSGMQRIADPDASTSDIMLSGLRLTIRDRKVRTGFIVRLINTAPEFGMFIIMPAVISTALGWGQTRWLLMTVAVYAGNILFNAFFGAVGDRYGWINTIRWCGIFSSAIALLAWWYVPHLVPAGSGWGYVLSLLAGISFGIVLAGFVPMGAVMAANSPGNESAAMAMYTTAAGATFLGSMVVALVLNATTWLGWESAFARNSAVIWAFVALYAWAFVIVGRLRTRQDDADYRRQLRERDARATVVVSTDPV